MSLKQNLNSVFSVSFPIHLTVVPHKQATEPAAPLLVKLAVLSRGSSEHHTIIWQIMAVEFLGEPYSSCASY